MSRSKPDILSSGNIPAGGVAVIFCLFLVFPFFFIGGPGYHAARSIKARWDLGHILFFFLFSWLVLDTWQRRKFQTNSILVFFRIFCVVAISGILIELLQMAFSTRQPDICDVLRNQLGCMLFFAFFSKKLASSLFNRLFRILAACLLLMALLPLLVSLYDEQRARQQFPVLSDFETPFEVKRWRNAKRLSRQKDMARHGEYCMKVQLTTAKYSGTSLFYFPRDWRGYEKLHFSVYYWGSKPLTLHCRIHDFLHKEHDMAFSDRFHKRFVLQTGWNDLQVSLHEVVLSPEGRKMEMQHIEGFGIFVVRQEKPLDIYIDDVYLQ